MNHLPRDDSNDVLTVAYKQPTRPRSRPRSIVLKHRRRFNFDKFLDVFERRAFRIGMLLVFLLWITDKVWHTAMTTDFIVHASTRTPMDDTDAIESRLMTDPEFRQRIADKLARLRAEARAEQEQEKPSAAETQNKPKAKRRKAR
jgi:hypothetical protein